MGHKCTGGCIDVKTVDLAEKSPKMGGKFFTFCKKRKILIFCRNMGQITLTNNCQCDTM